MERDKNIIQRASPNFFSKDFTITKYGKIKLNISIFNIIKS